MVPILVYEDVGRAIDWLCSVFGFSECLRAAGPGPPRPNEVNQYVVVHVEDVDRHYERAQGRGARILRPPTDLPFGERQYTAESETPYTC